MTHENPSEKPIAHTRDASVETEPEEGGQASMPVPLPPFGTADLPAVAFKPCRWSARRVWTLSYSLPARCPQESLQALYCQSGGTEMLQTPPFLLFDGNCAEAMTFYHKCLGGELTLTKLADTPMKDQFPVKKHQRLIDAYLRMVPSKFLRDRLDGIPVF